MGLGMHSGLWDQGISVVAPEVQGRHALARTAEGQNKKHSAASTGKTAPAAPVPTTEAVPVFCFK